MWTAKLLTFCWLAATGQPDCASEAPIQIAPGPAVEFTTEVECQRSMLVSAVHSAARGYRPIVSLHAECQRVQKGA